MKRAISALIAIPLLSACATAGSYPSLARRDAERIADAPPVAQQAEVASAADQALPARLDRLVSDARVAHSRFLERRARAEQLAAGATGTGRGTEPWALASIALADLESARSEAMIALADLDALHAADRVANPNTPSLDAATIAAARDTVLALITEEDRVLAALRGSLGD